MLVRCLTKWATTRYRTENKGPKVFLKIFQEGIFKDLYGTFHHFVKSVQKHTLVSVKKVTEFQVQNGDFRV